VARSTCGTDVRDIPVDHPALSQGWWAVEGSPQGLRRWTNGDAVLPLPAMDGTMVLEVRAGCAGIGYLVRDQEQSLAA